MTGYPYTRPKLSLPGSIFRFQLPARLFKIPTEHLSYTNGSLSFFLFTKWRKLKKGSKVTLADSLSHTLLCVMYLVCFELTAIVLVSWVGICAYCLQLLECWAHELLQHVHIYYDSNKTRETCVHIGYFIHTCTKHWRLWFVMAFSVCWVCNQRWSYLQWPWVALGWFCKITWKGQQWLVYLLKIGEEHNMEWPPCERGF